MEGECYLDSPEAVRRFFEILDPRPAPEQFCVFKQLSKFTPDEKPEVVIFFARAETICGLNQLATFVTNDFEAVQSPFGAGCSNIVAWPLKYLERGQLKAVLGGWDPSDRKFLKPDEITFAVPYEMFDRMVQPLAGLLPHQRGLENRAQKDRAVPQGLEGIKGKGENGAHSINRRLLLRPELITTLKSSHISTGNDNISGMPKRLVSWAYPGGRVCFLNLNF